MSPCHLILSNVTPKEETNGSLLNYSYDHDMNVVIINGDKIPIVAKDVSIPVSKSTLKNQVDIECITTTAVPREPTDLLDSYELVETITKTRALRESDDDINKDILLELTTKTEADRERDELSSDDVLIWT